MESSESLLSDDLPSVPNVLPTKSVKERCFLWWDSTFAHSTTTAYLTSPVSRRDMIPILCGPVGLLAFMDNYLHDRTAIPYLVTDGLHTIMSVLITMLLPQQSFWLDFWLIVDFSSYSLIMRYLFPAFDCQEIVFALMLILSGVQSGAVWVFMLISLVSLTIANQNQYAAFIYFCIVFGLAGFQFETRNSKLLHELHTQQKTTAFLLDHCSDGFCTVDVADGSMSEVSEKLEDTFKTKALSNIPFTDFVAENDRDRVENLYVLAASSAELTPVIVTCQTENVSFDAKIIPYTSAGGHISLCVQIFGEIRSTRDDDECTDGDVVPDLPEAHRFEVSNGYQIDTASLCTFDLTQTSNSTHSDERWTQTEPGVDAGVQTNTVVRPPIPYKRKWPRPASDGETQQDPTADDVDGLRPTQRRTRGASLLWIMRRWNLPLQPSNCCPLHAAVDEVKSIHRELKRQRVCKPLWAPYRTWQCKQCCAVHDKESVCFLCRTHRSEECDAATQEVSSGESIGCSSGYSGATSSDDGSSDSSGSDTSGVMRL